MLVKAILLILLQTASCAVKNNETVSEEDYGLIPQLFEFENYDQCMLLEEKALYCTFTFSLEPLNATKENHIWNSIKKLSADPKNYRHDLLRHGICVPTKCRNISYANQEIPITDKVELCYNKKYNSLGLKGNISNILCHTRSSKFPVDIYDITVGLFLVLYVILIMFASIYEGIARSKANDVYEKMFDTRGGKLIAAFSIPNNWHRLISSSNNPDVNKLRSMQGIRFYNMICVIFCHTIMASFAGPVANTKYVENITYNPLNMFVANGQYVVQTFFVISGWLLSFHFFQIKEEKKVVSMKHIFLALINRYLRLTPTLAAIVAFESTWLVHMGRGPIWDALVVQEHRHCRENWWTNILYINNYVGKKTMCLHQTWYLAADTQLFVFSLLLLKIASEVHRARIMLVLIVTMIIGVLIPASIAFLNNHDIVMRQYPELLYNMNVLNSSSWHELFSSGHSNITGYTIGLAAGFLFYRNKNTQLPVKKVHIILWWILTFGLCIFIILIAGIMYEPDYKFSRLESGLYWGFGKNIFAFGVAIAIFGFTQKIGWFARWICEWRAVQVFGRLTYSTYIIHVSLIRIRAGLSRYPVYINDYVMLHSTVGDIVLSYLGGTLLCLMIEMPVSALQKLIIPRTSK